MIRLENVNKYFNKHKRNEIHVIDNVSLEFENNGIVSLLGTSGSGKTTLLNSISGLTSVNSGNIYIDGKKITKRSIYNVDKIRNEYIGYIFQDYNLLNDLSVFDNVALSLKICGIKDKNVINERVSYALDKVNMLRYKNRSASMLSGGEKQRVAIARAIVKNPKIIIADEPTGNLDSKNTIEVMNIIKGLSKERLVILVTHEKNIAEFYSNRIICIEDGKIISDNINENVGDLDYRIDNKIYLKDFDNKEIFNNNKININYYSNDEDKVNIDIVLRNNNLYIRANKKIEEVNDNSACELIDAHYTKITKDSADNFEYKFNDNFDYKYSSIFNLLSFIKNGFNKLFNYSLAKKLLLIGFFMSGVFITNAVCNIIGITNIKDESFISINKNYINVLNKNISVNKYLEYENNDNVRYIIPGDSKVYYNICYDDFYQFHNSCGSSNASIVSSNLINDNDIIYGTNIINDKDIVIDKLTAERYILENNTKSTGIFSYKDLLNRRLYTSRDNYFTIVGFTDKSDPSMYVKEEYMDTIIYYSFSDKSYDSLIDIDTVKDNIISDNISLNDYEILVNYKYKDNYKLNSEIDYKVNDIKLKVVGYYKSNNYDKYIASSNTVKYDLIGNSEGFSVIANNNSKDLINELKSDGLNAVSSYEKSRSDYLEENKGYIKASLIVSGVIILVSMIEIYLMIRSSFLSRIKEVGIYRAIGTKRSDICKMFVGEIMAITSIGCLPGILLMSYIISLIVNNYYFASLYYINVFIMLFIILFVYVFNIIVGLIPVNIILLNRPSKILSRNDI